MSEKVSMPIECLGKMCMNCPELEIEVDKLHLSNGCDGYFVNELRCVHTDKCRTVYSWMKSDWEQNHVTRLEHRH